MRAVSLLDQFRLFADYNRLMNERLYAAVALLPDEELRRDRGAFFKSVLGTLNHLLVGDVIWLKRFAGHPSSGDVLADVSALRRPGSLDAILHHDFAALAAQRKRMDEILVEWIHVLSESDLADSITYRNMAGERFEKSYGSLISHLFLHQVHHRGQVTTLLSQAGVDFGETDLIEIIGEVGT